jgi:flagellar secretion chaperone FliS
MGLYGAKKAGKKYNDLSVETEVVDADPHRLVQLLFEGALVRLMRAKGCLERGETSPKCENLSRVLAILGHLQSSLDRSAGELADNLDELYRYMSMRVAEANVDNNSEAIDEVYGLLKGIKDAWDGIKPQGNVQHQANEASVVTGVV